MQNRVSQNIFWLTASRAFALVLLFFAYALLFRHLGPYGSGQFQFALSYVMIFGIVSDFGIQQFVTKNMSEEPDRLQNHFSRFLNFEILLSACLYLLLALIAYLRNFDTVVLQAVLVAGFGMALNALTYPFLAVMTVKSDIKKVALINFLNSAINISIILLAVFFNKYIVFLALVQPLFAALDLVLYRLFIRKHLPTLNIWKDLSLSGFKHVSPIIKKAWPFVLLVGFSAIYNRIDVLIISALTNYAQTGLYTAAYKFVDLLNFFPASVSHVLFPVLAALAVNKDIAQIKKNLEKYLKVMTVIALPMAVGGAILAGPLIALVAGKEFSGAAPVLSVLVWAVAILFIYIPVNSLVISQLTKKAAAITGLNMLVNIAGNLILIPKFGIMAAAAMTVVSETLQGLFYFYFAKEYLAGISFFGIWIKPAIASAVMGLVLYQTLAFGLYLNIVLGIFVYFILLLLFGHIKKTDYKLFLNLFQRGSE